MDSFKEFKKIFQKLDIKVIEGFYGFNIIKHFYFLNKTIRKEQIQIVQCYFYFEVFLAFLIKLVNKNLRIAFSFEGSSYPINIFAKPLISLSLRHVDQFIFISNYVKICSQEKFPFLLSKKFIVIHNGAKKRVEENRDGVVFENRLLTISGLNKYKNLFLLVQVMNILVNEKNLHLKLDIIGEGPLRVEIQNEIEKFNLCNYVKLLGYKSNVGEYLKKTTIYVHPSNMEGFGIAVVEAMLAKKLVIVSNAGALPEVVINNESGVLVNYNDPVEWEEKICQLLQNEDKRNELALNGYERAKKLFLIEVYVEKLDNLYEELLS
jgi:glycosyltransferase involved in cell wall biosynthesis